MPREKKPVEPSLPDLPPSSSKFRMLREDITIEGKRLETLYIAPSSSDSKSKIVLLHEGLGSASLWGHFPAKLADATGHGILAYSRYGHGRSQGLGEKRRRDFMHHEARVILPQLLEHFGIERPIVLGHSDGGSIGLIYAGTSPQKIRGLILEAPHVFVEELSLRSIRAIGEMYEQTSLGSKLARYHDNVDEMFWAWNNIWLDPSFREWNIEEFLAPISCPVLVIQGEQDEYGTLAQVAAIQKRVPKTEALILPRCGHAPHRDRPKETLGAISKFIATLG